METMADYLDQIPAKPLRPNSVNFFGNNYGKFLVSQLKAFFGPAATAGNDFAYSWIPKPEKNSSWLTIHDEARAGRLDGIIYGGFTGVTVGPDSKRMAESLANLKWLVIMDPLPTSASEFWHAGRRSRGHPDRSAVPPGHPLDREVGVVHQLGPMGAVEAQGAAGDRRVPDDNQVLGELYRRVRELYEDEGGAFPDPVLNIHWPYADPANPGLEELAREVNGVDLRTGQQLSTFANLTADGNTSSGNWIYCGSWTEAGNQMDRRGRGPHRPRLLPQLGLVVAAQPADPLQPGVGRRQRPALGSHRPGISWNGSKWVGDVPDFPATSAPTAGQGAFIMTGEGVGRLFAPRNLTTDGPFPEHYEQTEAPIDNLLSGTRRNPAVPVRGRSGQLRRGRRRLPVRRHHLPGHRARALRDPERALSGRGDARLLRRDPGRAGGGEGHRERRSGPGDVQAGRGGGRRPRHQAHAPAAGRRRQGRLPGRHPRPLALRRWQGEARRRR